MKHIILGILLLISVNIRTDVYDNLDNCKTFKEETVFIIENWDLLTNENGETDFDILINPKYEDQVKLFIQILLSQETQKECPLQTNVGEFLEKNKMSHLKMWKTKLLLAYYIYTDVFKHKLKNLWPWKKQKNFN